MAHEVNNALQVISGSAELLEARELDASVKRRVEIIRTHAGKAAATIDQLRSYSRQGPAAVQAVDLASLVDEAIAMCAYTINRARIGIAVERSDSEPYNVTVDRKQTLRLFLNLLFAAEEMLGGSEGGRISVHLARQPQVVVASVKTSVGSMARAAESGKPDSPAAAVTTNSQLWAASRLATLQNGRLDVSVGDTGFSVTLTFQAVPREG